MPLLILSRLQAVKREPTAENDATAGAHGPDIPASHRPSRLLDNAGVGASALGFDLAPALFARHFLRSLNRRS
jgi:hypothetical protein